jgi:DNA-binding beta-propeller fold protein YncE
MTSYPKSARKRAARPVLEGLETRELLSAIPAHHAHAAIVAARVHVPTIAQLPTAPTQSASTVPANGDVNPYGIAFVPAGFPKGGPLMPGDLLIANFNNSDNLQGTGTTIVRVTPSLQTSVFYQGPPGVGLDTGLAVLKRGYVIVGALPSTDGTSATAGQGSLLVLDRNGQVVANFADPALLNGPWDLTVHDAGNRGQVFVSNVLSGTVSRFNFVIGAAGHIQISSAVQIASGYAFRGDPAAFELGPTGLAFDAARNTLYVASTADNAVYAIPFAGSIHRDHGTGKVIYQDNTHLHGPLGLTFLPDGNLIVANGDVINPDPNNTSTLVEFTRTGKFVGQFSISTSAGGAFGVTATFGRNPLFAAVNDITNTVEVWQVHT